MTDVPPQSNSRSESVRHRRQEPDARRKRRRPILARSLSVRFRAFDVSRDAIGVVVFQRRPTDQARDLTLALCLRRAFTILCIRLESNSTGSSFPADRVKSVPLAVILLDSSQGQ